MNKFHDRVLVNEISEFFSYLFSNKLKFQTLYFFSKEFFFRKNKFSQKYSMYMSTKKLHQYTHIKMSKERKVVEIKTT